MLLCGGLLEFVRRQGKEPATESGSASEGTGPQREERGEGVGGAE